MARLLGITRFWNYISDWIECRVHLRPEKDSALDLGSSDYRWKAAYVDALAATDMVTTGVEDTTAGIVRVHGGATGSPEGGEIQLMTAADHDGTYNYWRIDAYQDVLRFGTPSATQLTLTPAGTLRMTGDLVLGPGTTLTISSGAITITGSYHRLDTEGGAASDDLTTINGGSVGSILILSTINSNRDVTVKASGTMYLAGDCTLNTSVDYLVLIRQTSNVWCELCRSNNL